MKKKILIIDDDDAILEALELMLVDAGYDVLTSINADKTIPLAKKYLPDIILLDMLISGHDGREIAKELKSLEKTKSIPVIMFSAHPKADDYFREAGADDFLPKPFDIEILLQMVAKYTEK